MVYFFFFLLFHYNILTAVRPCHSNKVVSVFMNWNVSPEFPFWEIQISVSANSLGGERKKISNTEPSPGKASRFPSRLKLTQSRTAPHSTPDVTPRFTEQSFVTAEGFATLNPVPPYMTNLLWKVNPLP